MVQLDEEFLSAREADQLLQRLVDSVGWRQDHIKMFGNEIPLPRLTAWYGDSGAAYTYSGILQEPSPWTPELSDLRTRLEEHLGARFNSVLLNRYRSGDDHLSWHSDDEPELGLTPTIASLSLGGSRSFSFRRKGTTKAALTLELSHGSLLVMRGSCQREWDHRITKTKRTVAERINLTFRWVSH